MQFPHFFFRFLTVSTDILSTQTLCQSLQTCVDLHAVTNESFWKDETKYLSKKLCEYQHLDGGFSNGYTWIGAGKEHKAEYSAAPELECIYALQQYYNLSQAQDETIKNHINKGIQWIKKYCFKIDCEKYAIPYDPYVSKDVFINNAVSFTIKPLSEYIKKCYLDDKAFEIYKGMILFLKDELEKDKNYNGKFWMYFYQDSADVPATDLKRKLENHHIGMQLAHHCIAQKNIPIPENIEIIKEVATYLCFIQKENGLIPFLSNVPSNIIDVWGFAPCAIGFIEAYDVLKDEKYLRCAKLVIDWIVEHSWNGDYFIPTLSHRGKAIDDNYYPRSDAWVIHSISHYMSYVGYDENLYRICKKAYQKIKNSEFRGKENHAWNFRKKIVIYSMNFIKTGKWRDYK